MRIITNNLNGIREALTKGFLIWLKSVKADVVRIQETKARPEQVPVEGFDAQGYHVYIHSAMKNNQK